VKWFIAVFAFWSFSALAANVHTFVPPNDLLVYESRDVQANKIAQASFNAAIDLVSKHYTAYVASRYGAILQINNLWSDPTVNSQAYRQGNVWMIDAFGGLARFGQISTAGYVAVLCHELGHHLGGAPRYPNDWASAEGQSDYWGFAQCMTVLYPKALAYDAGVNLADVLARLGGEKLPNPKTPDPTKVTKTNVDHPRAQCRLDTFIAAISGLSRPRCWYKPR
jgi:hypothetical protein